MTTSARRRIAALVGTAAVAAATATVALVALQPGVGASAPTVVKIDQANPTAPIAATGRSPAVSDDGKVATFIVGGPGGTSQAVVRDMASQTTTVVGPPQGVVRVVGTGMSGNGCKVAFWGSTDVGGPAIAPAAPAAAVGAGSV